MTSCSQGNGRPALRRDVNPMLIGVALAEIAEIPAGQMIRARIISLWTMAA
jgi:hypothetical protein